MAHHRRKKARINTYTEPRWGRAPSWHNLLFNTRPRRRAQQLLLQHVRAGRDPEALPWPLGNHKPHSYYW